jgi:hypothetical protein
MMQNIYNFLCTIKNYPNIYKKSKIKDCKTLISKQKYNTAKQVSKDTKLSKIQGFMYVLKTIHNKPCTTKQKQKKLKQRNKRHEIKNKRNEKKQREKKTLLKKKQVVDYQLSTTPNSCKKECKGVVQDSSTNSNTLTIVM